MNADMTGKFKVVAVGGTFDNFHRGHRVLLFKAFEVGNNVLIGLCTDKFAEKLRKPHKVATYNERVKEIEAFLRDHKVRSRAKIIPLSDSYGVTLSSSHLDAIVVSRETESRAHEINEKRKSKGLPPLNIIVVEIVQAENGTSISTTRIRRKEIDHDGRLLKPSSKKT